jgi:phospholipid/cholesterol/gamma-HCH transport system substrate-binding protein
MTHNAMRIATGAFVAAALAIMVFGIGYILHRKGVFEEQFRFTLVAESGRNLSVGTPVTFEGFRLGAVTELRLDEQGRVLAAVSVPEDQRRWLRRSSRFTLEKPLIGSPAITVATDSLEAPLLAKGARVSMGSQNDINQLIQQARPVVAELQSIVSSLDTLTTDAARPEGDLRQFVAHLEQVTARWARQEALLTTFTGDPDSPDRLRRILENTGAGTRSAERMLRELRTRTLDEGGTLDRVEGLLEELDGQLRTLRPAVEEAAAAGAELKPLQEELQVTLEDTRALLERVRRFLGEDAPKEVPLP